MSTEFNIKDYPIFLPIFNSETLCCHSSPCLAGFSSSFHSLGVDASSVFFPPLYSVSEQDLTVFHGVGITLMNTQSHCSVKCNSYWSSRCARGPRRQQAVAPILSLSTPSVRKLTFFPSSVIVIQMAQGSVTSVLISMWLSSVFTCWSTALLDALYL